MERRPPVGTTARSAVKGVAPFAQMVPPARDRRSSDRHRRAERDETRVPPQEKKCGNGLERRPPVGTVARSATNCVAPFVRMVPPARDRRSSDRHRGPPGREKRVPPMEKKRGDGLERRPPVGTVARSATKRTSSTSCTTGTLPRQSPCRARSGGASRAIRIIRSNTSSHSAVSAASAPPSADPGSGQAAPSSVAAFSR